MQYKAQQRLDARGMQYENDNERTAFMLGYAIGFLGCNRLWAGRLLGPYNEFTNAWSAGYWEGFDDRKVTPDGT